MSNGVRCPADPWRKNNVISGLLTQSAAMHRWSFWCLHKLAGRCWSMKITALYHPTVLLKHIEAETCNSHERDHFADDIEFRRHFLDWKSLYIGSNSIEFYSQGSNWQWPSLLVQIIAWRSIDDKALSEPMMTYFTDVYFASLSLSVFIIPDKISRRPHSRPKRIPRSYPSLKNTPFSRILDVRITLFSTEIADFEAQ